MRRAFTLIELLVVIGIIGLLVSLTLPSLASARKTAQGLVCQTRLRQLDQTSQMYAVESKDYLPFANSSTAESSGQWTAAGWLYKYQIAPGYTYTLQDAENGLLWRYLNLHDIYRCPMDIPPYNLGMLQTMSSYCMNVAIHGNRTALPSYRIGQYKSWAVVFWESNELGNSSCWNDGNNEPSQGISGRHFGSGNMAAIDGSVQQKSVNDFALLSAQTPGPLYCNPGQADGMYPP